MSSFDVDARYDDSRPEGGHAVILISGLSGLEEPVRFRLRPIDADLLHEDNSSFGQTYPAVACRNVDGGSEIVIGPAVTEHPSLNAGSIVELELPDYGVRSELIWPSIVPLARPRRTAHIARRAPSIPRIEPAPPLKEMELRALIGAAEDPSLSHSTPAMDVKIDGFIATGSARPAGVQVEPPLAASPPSDVVIADAEVAPKSIAAVNKPAELSQSPPVRDVLPLRDQPVAQKQSIPTSAIASIENTVEPSPRQPRGFSLLPSSPIGAALTSALGVLGVVWLLGGPSNPLISKAPVASATPPVAAVAPAALPAPRGAAEPAADGALYHLLNSGPASPRGVVAIDMTAQKALENAQAALNSPGAPRDPEEGAYWLRKYVQSLGNDESTRRALTQLGSALADSSNRDFDYGKARLAWEMASAFGDPVAMCFLGTLHENGLGGPVDRRLAHVWYERSKRAGGCAAVDEAIARVKP